MHQLDYAREELCFELQKLPSFELVTSRYAFQAFDNKISTTIYFGATSTKWEGIKTLSSVGVGIKVRFYETNPRHDLFQITNDTRCVVELKRSNGSHGDTIKDKAGLEVPITYGDFLNYISFITNSDIETPDDFQSITPTLVSFIEKYEITGLFPVGASSYTRNHFLGKDHRISIDTAVRFYTACVHNDDVVFSLSLASEKPILEIKKPHDLNLDNLSIMEILSNSNIDFEQTKISKGMRVGELAREPHIFIEPELNEKADNDWVITEREIKLDAQSDPRSLISTVPIGDGINIFSGNPLKNINFQKVYNVGPSGIVYMSADLNGTDPMLKYKTFMHNDSLGALVRKEVVIPYALPSLEGLTHELEDGINLEQVVVTPYFCRDRIKLNVYMASTRNVFEIYGDHSFFVTGDFADFNQVEIEYAGVIYPANKKLPPQDKLELDVNNDFYKLRELVLDIFIKQEQPLSPSIRSKYDWANTEVFKTVKN